MAAWMAQWLFTYNTPMVMTNFFYTCFLICAIIGIATGIYAAKAHKKAEEFLPADEAFEAAAAEKAAAKAAKA